MVKDKQNKSRLAIIFASIGAVAIIAVIVVLLTISGVFRPKEIVIHNGINEVEPGFYQCTQDTNDSDYIRISEDGKSGGEVIIIERDVPTNIVVDKGDRIGAQNIKEIICKRQ